MNAKRKINQLKKLVKRIHQEQDKLTSLSDEELQAKTPYFRELLKQGKTLDDILVEAVAVICEADKRVLGKNPRDVQIMGGVAMHQGYLVEMNTGEGKTLTATVPLYVNGLSGKGAILVTNNEYLAARDAEEMGEVYRFMGLTIEAGVTESSEEHIENSRKKEIYAADIVYTTHGTLGFDYLLENLAVSDEDRYLRPFNFIIIDEADSVLLDSASTPLVISGSPRVQSNLYEMADFFVTTLREDIDYTVEEKMAWLTEDGIKAAEKYFKIDNFFREEYFELYRHVVLALRAHTLMEIRQDYVISDSKELVLLDNASGRLMKGVKLRGGMHQALEAKEHLEISQETRSMASITFQNFFRLFPIMSGMSGTISDAAEEIRDVYDTDVLVIPPHKEVERIDKPDKYYQNAKAQFTAALAAALEAHATGQPVLIVTSTIPQTEVVSKLLLEEKVSHNVLNANNAFWEAKIIAEAGQKNAVTVATSMAGRGTDIKLGEGVKELGGLCVIGIGRMINVRQERQARGRAGRQGDPGISRFFVSLEDDIVIQNGPKNLDKMVSSKIPITKSKLKDIIDKTQRLGEEYAVQGRRKAMDYDLVLSRQRNMIYDSRNRLLSEIEFNRGRFTSICKGNIDDFVRDTWPIEKNDLIRYIQDNISYTVNLDEIAGVELTKKDEVRKYLINLVRRTWDDKKFEIGGLDNMQEFARIAMLTAVDNAWVEQVDYLQQLQSALAGRSSAQRNLTYEYQAEGLESYRQMENNIRKQTMRIILLSQWKHDKKGKLIISPP